MLRLSHGCYDELSLIAAIVKKSGVIDCLCVTVHDSEVFTDQDVVTEGAG